MIYCNIIKNKYKVHICILSNIELVIAAVIKFYSLLIFYILRNNIRDLGLFSARTL